MTKHSSYKFLATLLIFVFFFLSIFHEITFPFVVGLAIAYTFAPLVDKAQHMLSRALVSAIITLSIVSMFVLFVFTCTPKIEHQVQVVIKNAYHYSDSIVSFCNNMLESLHLQPIDMMSLQNFFVRKIDLIINTPIGADSTSDDSYLRKGAIKKKIPYMTTMAAAKATASGMISMGKPGCGDVKSLQEWHSEIKDK